MAHRAAWAAGRRRRPRRPRAACAGRPLRRPPHAPSAAQPWPRRRRARRVPRAPGAAATTAAQCPARPCARQRVGAPAGRSALGAAPGVALARSRPGPFRHYAQQASLRRARWQAQAQAAHAARTPGRARPEAAHTRLLAHVRRALHKQRPRQRVRGRLHGGCRHHACGHNGALQARAGRAAPAPARAAPVSGRRRRRTRCDVSPSRHAAAAPAEPRSADASRACLLCGRRVACALLATHPHDLHCQAPGVALAGPARLQRAPSVPRPTQVLSSEQLEWATLRGRLYGQHVGCLLTGGRAAQQCRPAGGFAAAGPPLTPTRGMLEA